MLECWTAGVLECWTAGVLDCWTAGVEYGEKRVRPPIIANAAIGLSVDQENARMLQLVFPFFAGGVFPMDIFSSSAKAVPLDDDAPNKTPPFHAGAIAIFSHCLYFEIIHTSKLLRPLKAFFSVTACLKPLGSWHTAWWKANEQHQRTGKEPNDIGEILFLHQYIKIMYILGNGIQICLPLPPLIVAAPWQCRKTVLKSFTQQIT